MLKEKGLKKLFCKHKVLLVYIFGSQKDKGLSVLKGKKATPLPGSDLDIGLLFSKMPEDIYPVHGEIFNQLSECFEPFPIDLVILNEVNVFLQYEAIKGHLIYSSDEHVQEKFEEGVMKRAEDLLFKKKEFDREVSEAIRDGYFEIELG